MEEIKMLKNYKSFELLEQYLSYLTVIKGRSINTVIEYRTDVLMFFEFLCNKRNMEREKYDLSMIDNEFVNSITLNDMYAFISHCQTESKASAGTRARKIVSILNIPAKISTLSGRLVPTNPDRSSNDSGLVSISQF
jgi:site-specific recombinase XerD